MRRKLFLSLLCVLLLAGSSLAGQEQKFFAHRVIQMNVMNSSSEKILRGLLYMPETDSKVPLVITAHELGSNYARRWPAYGEALASQGIAVYTFDFAGGGPKARKDGTPGSHSDGETTEMSVMTEVKDLECVLEAAKSWKFVDTKKIAIIGGSQGGAVSVITAARHSDEIAGLVLLYPALLIQDDLHKKFAKKEDCPPVYSYNGWLDVSPVYVNDMWDYDVYADMPKYSKPVLILHGDKDTIVPMNYIERAVETYPDSEFHIINDGEHGFQGKTFAQAIGYIKNYFRKVGIMNAEPLSIKEQGIFSAGGTVTEPMPGEFNVSENWLDFSRAGNTAHVDHANVFYQIPDGRNKTPIVYLHGYGQTRTGWQSTPDRREGWSDIFLRKGRAAFLVDQPRRGAAGSTVKIVNNEQDTRVNGTEFNPGDQAWYTHFRIGRGTPNRYEGSQFPAGEEALNQFLRQMTPNTGNYDVVIFGRALSAVLSEVRSMTGKKAVYLTHSQGGRVGWQTDTENIAAIVAIEPGFAPEVGSETYKKFVAAKIPMIFYFGDYIENGPDDIKSTAFWKSVLDQCRDFAKHYNEDGGDAVVVYLPDEGITGNSHFMFQELNNQEIAAHIEKWLESKGL